MKSSPERHDAVILAAGGSRRLGQPKQMLTANGETLLSRTVRHVVASRPERLVVVLGAGAEAMRRHVDTGTVLVNPDWASGMASSLKQAARELAGRDLPVLVTVVDQPALTDTHFSALLDAWDGSRDVVTVYGDAMGVPALLQPTTLQGAQSLDGDQGFRRLWRERVPQTVRADELGHDLDTEDDLRRAIAAGLIDP